MDIDALYFDLLKGFVDSALNSKIMLHNPRIQFGCSLKLVKNITSFKYCWFQTYSFQACSKATVSWK